MLGLIRSEHRRHALRRRRTIFLAGPCGLKTGGMYQVSVYLMQGSSAAGDGDGNGRARLELLDTRGPGSAVWSFLYVLLAIVRIVWARLAGHLAGVHIHVSERLSLVRKGLLVAACRAVGARVVMHLHAAQLEENYAALPPAGRALVRWMFRLPHCCIALGQGAASFLAVELGVDRDRIEIVTNGVPHPLASREPVPAAESDEFKVLFVGNLSERKGVSVLLRALAHPTLRQVPVALTLAGHGDIVGYEVLAQELGVAHKVRFTGWADKATVDRLLAQCDVFVLPSFNEGLPLAILEALALGVPTVCTPVGEIPHVLEHGRTAHLVAAGDHEALAGAIAQLRGQPALRAALSQGARAAYERRFSLDVFARAVAGVHLRHLGASSLANDGGGVDVLLPSPTQDALEALNVLRMDDPAPPGLNLIV